MSVAMPRIAAALGGLPWPEVQDFLEVAFLDMDIPVYVYADYVPELDADETQISRPGDDIVDKPILFWGTKYSQWRGLSNFERSPIVIDGKEYLSVEHFFQSSKAATQWEHEMIRGTPSPKEAKRVGRTVALRPDWEEIKMDVMLKGLLAKFRQHEQFRDLLLSTGTVMIRHRERTFASYWPFPHSTRV